MKKKKKPLKTPKSLYPFRKKSRKNIKSNVITDPSTLD
jgi:hypothetical protein